MTIRAAFLSVAACLIFSATSADAQSASESGDRVSEVAAQAKQQGKQNAEIPPKLVTPTSVASLTEVAKDYSVVIATPTQLLSKPTQTGIDTWIKFRLDETIITQDVIDTTDILTSAPTALLPIQGNEFLVMLSGGRVFVDGVSVVQKITDNISFKLRQRYLLFVYFDTGGNNARLAALANGVFSIDSQGTLASLGLARHSLVREVNLRFHNKLDELRPALRQLKP